MAYFRWCQLNLLSRTPCTGYQIQDRTQYSCTLHLGVGVTRGNPVESSTEWRFTHIEKRPDKIRFSSMHQPHGQWVSPRYCRWASGKTLSSQAAVEVFCAPPQRTDIDRLGVARVLCNSEQKNVF